MDGDAAAPVAGWLGLPQQQHRPLLRFLGFLVAAAYSFLIVRAVDQMREASPAASYSAELEQPLRYCMVWTLGLLAMLLPVMLADSPRLVRMAIDFLRPMIFQ